MGNTAGINNGKGQKYYQPSVDDNVSLPSVAILSAPTPTPYAPNGTAHHQNSRPSSRQMVGQEPRSGQRITMEVERRDPGMGQSLLLSDPRVTETVQRRSIDMGGEVDDRDGPALDRQEVLKRREINMRVEPRQLDTARFHSMKEIKQYLMENPNLMSGRLKVSKEAHGIEKYKQKPKQVKTKQNTYLDLIHPSVYQSHQHSLSYHPKVSVGVVYPPPEQQENYMNPRQAPPLRPVKVDQEEYLNYVGSHMGSQRSGRGAPMPRGYVSDGSNRNLLPSKDGILKHQSSSKQPVMNVEWQPQKQQSGTLQSRKSNLDSTDGRKSNLKSVIYSDSPVPPVESRSQKPGKKSKQKTVDLEIPAKNSKGKLKTKVLKKRGYSPQAPDDHWSINSKNSEIASSASDKDSGNIKPLYFKKTLAFSTAYHGEEMVFDPVESDVLY